MKYSLFITNSCYLKALKVLLPFINVIITLFLTVFTLATGGDADALVLLLFNHF